MVPGLLNYTIVDERIIIIISSQYFTSSQNTSYTVYIYISIQEEFRLQKNKIQYTTYLQRKFYGKPTSAERIIFIQFADIELVKFESLKTFRKFVKF